MTLRLYSAWRATAPYRVRIGLAIKGMAYDYSGVDLLAGQQRSPEYRAVNPQGLTPALVGNGLAVEEEPEAGSAVRRGSRVTVRFGRAAGSQAPNSKRGNHSTAARNPAQRE